MTGKKDIYVYLQCTDCYDIFRVFKSQYPEDVLILLECPNCHVMRWSEFFLKVSRKMWNKSNEVKPDSNDNT